MPKYDVVVVGAGTGGSTAAKTMADKGYKVCLIDQKPKGTIGDKVCGEALEKFYIDDLGMPPPRGEELAGIVRGVDIFSPDLKSVFRLGGEAQVNGFMINRLAFGQRLLGEALDSGVELMDNTRVTAPVMDSNYVKGVFSKSAARSETAELDASVVIDASGMAAVIRRQAPSEWCIEREIPGEDVQVCYQEIREVPRIEEPQYLQIYLNQDVSPGGYYWIFPKGEKKVNVGLGIQMKHGSPNPREQLYRHVLSKPFFNNSKRIDSGGGGIVSTRRPLSSMVGNGVVFVGDAACQPNPIHGGGIGASMVAGRLAAETACGALDRGDISRKGLWRYNSEYMTVYGARTAISDVFRILLQKCSNSDLNRGMRDRLVREQDILKASLGEELNLGLIDKVWLVFRGIRVLSFIRALARTAEMTKVIKEMYVHFPEPEESDKWSANVDSLIKNIKENVVWR